MSLDGVAENIAGLFMGGDDEQVDAVGADVIATQDAVVLGRRTDDEWAPFWPGSNIEPFASFINAVPKYVATSTPLDTEWTNATVIDGGLVNFVRDLKNHPGGDIGVHVSIVVAQAIAGVGRRLLDGVPPIHLAPIRSAISPTGFFLLDYRVQA